MTSIIVTTTGSGEANLGLAVLNENGDAIVCRLPLPIYTLRHGIPLPQSQAEYHEFMKGPHAAGVLVLP